jgi:hypothetical protein
MAMRRQLLALAYVSGIFLTSAIALNYVDLIVFYLNLLGGPARHWFVISILSTFLCFYWAWKLYRLVHGQRGLDGAWSFTFIGTACLVCAVLCAFPANYPESIHARPLIPIVFLALSFSGAALAIVDVVRKKRVLSAWIVCIANLTLLLPYFAIRTVIHFF